MNIEEILKYCPKYTKLYSPTWGNVKLIEVTSTKVIKIKVYNYTEELTSEGCYSVKGECILFPSKNQRDWNKFRLPVKRGDIMMNKDGKCPFIANGDVINTLPKFICGITFSGSLKFDNNCYWIDTFYIPASEEAKKELFDKMAEAGYKWNANTLKLEKIESKFKEGDVIIDNQGSLCLASKIRDDSSVIIAATLYANKALNVFISNNVNRCIQLVTIASTTDRNKLYSALTRKGYKYDKDQHKLVKQEFKPFEKVLVRDDTNKEWSIDLFSYYDEENKNFPYVCMHIHYRYCIPYEGNEYLLGTTNDIKN
jgi:hypothetical protein